MHYDHTISGLLRKRDKLMGERQAHREAMACIHNDVEAIDRVLTAMGYVSDLQPRETSTIAAMQMRFRNMASTPNNGKLTISSQRVRYPATLEGTL